MSKGSYPEKLIIGTRGSPLALAQANEVRNKLLSLDTDKKLLWLYYHGILLVFVLV